MRAVLDLLRRERPARPFFLAQALASLGTGAGYVAILLVTYDRTPSPWAVTLVLLADFLPSMVLGPLLGAAADRWPRRLCAVTADLVRAVAFVGIALADDLALTVAFALLAGLGNGLFAPAALAWLPQLVQRERLAAGTSLYGALADLGWTAGPGLAALALLATGPQALLLANAVTFAASAMLLSRLDDAPPAPADDDAPDGGSLIARARAGLRAARRVQGMPVLLAAGAAGIFLGGALNLGEFLLAEEELGAGDTGFAALVAVYGIGVAAGSLSGARGGGPFLLKVGFLLGLALHGVAITGSGLAPGVAVAMVTFALTGLGEGAMLVRERLLIQTTVPDRFLGRLFGLRDTLYAWAFAGAFVISSAVAAALGPRVLFLITGVLCAATAAGATLALRGRFSAR